MSNIDCFKDKLEKLLREYDATIGVFIDGDTHGSTYSLCVCMDRENHELIQDCFLDASDLKVNTI